jgi:hypothetical protein
LLQQMFDGAPRLPIGDRQLLLAIAIRGESPYSGPVRPIAAICSLAMCCPMTGGGFIVDGRHRRRTRSRTRPPSGAALRDTNPMGWPLDRRPCAKSAGSPRTRTLMTRVEADRHGVGRRCPQIEREMSALLAQRRPLLFVHVMCEIDFRQGSCDTPTFWQSEPTVVVNLRCSSTRGDVFRPPPVFDRPIQREAALPHYVTHMCCRSDAMTAGRFPAMPSLKVGLGGGSLLLRRLDTNVRQIAADTT